jgi:hypothetical protein
MAKLLNRSRNLSTYETEFQNFKRTYNKKMHTYNTMNGIIKRHFGKQMTTETKLRTLNTTSKAAPRYRREMWVLNNGDKQRLEAVQMNFLRPLLGFTKLEYQRNAEIRKKTTSPKQSGRQTRLSEELEKARRKIVKKPGAKPGNVL